MSRLRPCRCGHRAACEGQRLLQAPQAAQTRKPVSFWTDAAGAWTMRRHDFCMPAWVEAIGRSKHALADGRMNLFLNSCFINVNSQWSQQTMSEWWAHASRTPCLRLGFKQRPATVAFSAEPGCNSTKAGGRPSKTSFPRPLYMRVIKPTRSSRIVQRELVGA